MVESLVAMAPASSSRKWPAAFLREVLKPVERSEPPVPGTTYRQLGVQLWGKGAYERETIDGADTKYGSFTRLKEGDVVVNKIWARHGSVAVVPRELDGCFVSTEFPAFEPDTSRLDPRWVHWLTKTKDFWAQCDEKSRGSSGKNRIRPEFFLEIIIPFPPIAEQRRIVARVEELAAKVEEVRRIAQDGEQEMAALAGSYLDRLFGNPYAGQSGTLGIRTFAKVDELVDDVADGPHVTPTYFEDGVPFVTALNISSGKLTLTGLKHISEDEHRQFQRRARAERGDVLITKDGTIGVPCLVDTDKEFSFFVSVALIKPKKDRLDGRFLAWALRSPYLQARMKERARGDMIRHLVLREIRELLVPCPPVEQQRKIVRDLESFNQKLAEASDVQARRKAELDALLPSILDKAFKGDL